MLKSKLFKKYLLIGFSLTIIFFIFGWFTNHMLMTIDRELHRKSGPPPHFKSGKPPFHKNGGLPPPPPRHKGPMFKIMAVQLLAILLAVGSTILIILLHFKGRTKEINRVINQIKNGDLKARMPLGDQDEFGLAMGKFNEMADEIESLVNKLRKTEATRRVLLSELAHDIRTPLASANNLIEILKSHKSEKLMQEQRNELLELSSNEINYIAKLVEDLLFLGKIEEPGYKKVDTQIRIKDIIENISNQLKLEYTQLNFEINSPQDLNLQMDTVLTHRLMRNALANAASFAKSKVLVNIEQVNDRVLIKVIDDGPGVSPELEQTFGYKKFSRAQINAPDGSDRISIGLGAVIMRSIAENYGGQVRIFKNPKELGSTLIIELKA